MNSDSGFNCGGSYGECNLQKCTQPLGCGDFSKDSPVYPHDFSVDHPFHLGLYHFFMVPVFTFVLHQQKIKKMFLFFCLFF